MSLIEDLRSQSSIITLVSEQELYKELCKLDDRKASEPD